MARRLLVFGFACVIIGTPLLSDVCEVICAEQAAQSATSTSAAVHQHHQHADAPASEPARHRLSHSAPALFTWHGTPMPMSHECRDLETAVTESRDVTKASVVSAVVTTVLVNQAIVDVRPVSQADTRHGPPAPVHTTSPLRI